MKKLRDPSPIYITMASFNLKENVPLSPMTWYKIGGQSRYYTEVSTEQTAFDALEWAQEKKMPVFILGDGSNILVNDQGFHGLTLRFTKKGIEHKIKRKQAVVLVWAATLLDQLVDYSVANALEGIAWAAGCPGTVGAAIRGNVGAFGGETSQYVFEARIIPFAYKEDWSIIGLKPAQQCLNRALQFDYRASLIKQKGSLVICAQYHLTPVDSKRKKELEKEAADHRHYRKTRHPLEFPNVGSVFKNVRDRKDINKIIEALPDLREKVERQWYGKVPAAVLIQRCDMVGFQVGGVRVSEKHANFFINTGNARAGDVAALVKKVAKTVYEQFGVILETEIQPVGFEKNPFELDFIKLGRR